MSKLSKESREAIRADAQHNAVGAGVGDTLRLLDDYAALEAELAKLRAGQEPVGYVDITSRSFAKYKSAMHCLPLYAAPVGERAFAREDRYIVVKVSDLEAVGQRNAMQDWLRNYGVRTRSCVVVEADWPEYEPVWQMIEARMTGTAPQPNAVPDVSRMARVLSDRAASACCVDPEDNWKVYGHEFIDDVRAMLAVTPSTPLTISTADIQSPLNKD